MLGVAAVDRRSRVRCGAPNTRKATRGRRQTPTQQPVGRPTAPGRPTAMGSAPAPVPGSASRGRAETGRHHRDLPAGALPYLSHTPRTRVPLGAVGSAEDTPTDSPGAEEQLALPTPAAQAPATPRPDVQPERSHHPQRFDGA
jgi:hypothetical protein